MTITEFDIIRPYLKDDIDINIQINKTKTYKLIPEYWGNHDGRWNVKCEKCGWQSPDIPCDEDSPYIVCPN